MIGTSDVDAITNPRIIIFGNTHATLAGTIQYVAPTSSGSHIFYTSATQITRMTISNAGVNINNDLGVSGNIGIGTTNPQNKLHIFNNTTNTTSLSIQNNFASGLPNEIISSPTATTTGIDGTDRYMIFTYRTDTGGVGLTEYSFNLGTNYNVDILVVGGGGGGGQGTYENGGGGGGGIVYMVNKSFVSGNGYKVIVGKGGAAATVGYDSRITFNNTPMSFDNISVIGKGDGGAGGGAGGSGAGGNKNGGLGTATQGNTFWVGNAYVAGGFKGQNGGAYSGGGGGGAGEAGGTEGGLEGGDGRPVSITGSSVFYGGGGPGGGYGITKGGDGGGGGTGNWGSSEASGAPNTGGGGGGAYSASMYSGGVGGSGVVIIRYRNSVVPSTTSSIELIKSTVGDATNDYKIENYDGNFQVKTSINNTDTDILSYYKAFNSFNFGGGCSMSSINTSRISVSGNIEATGTILSSGNLTSYGNIIGSDTVFARNGFDTIIRSNTGGCYLEMGDIGNTNMNNHLLRLGAWNGTTNIDSGSGRSIWIRSNGYRWVFGNAGESYNGANTTTWTAGSDHRIEKNIKTANLNMCYNNVKNVNVYRYNYIDGFNKGTQHDKTQLGFIAQQVQQHFPKSVSKSKMRIEDKREIPDFASVNIDQINFTLFGAVKQLIRVVEKQSKRIKKLEEMLNIADEEDDDEVDNNADEPYERIVCDEVDIDTIEPSEPTPDTPIPQSEPPADIPSEPPADIPMPMG
jgi:hypothetical protein